MSKKFKKIMQIIDFWVVYDKDKFAGDVDRLAARLLFARFGDAMVTGSTEYTFRTEQADNSTLPLMLSVLKMYVTDSWCLL